MVQFMQGLLCQFKDARTFSQFEEYGLYLNNNKELLKALSSEGESPNLGLTRSFWLEYGAQIGKGAEIKEQAEGCCSRQELLLD